MDFAELLARLRSYEPSEFPFVTIYLNSHWREEFHKKRTRLFLKNHWETTIDEVRREKPSNPKVRSLQDDRARIDEYVRDAMRGTIDARCRGLAIFASHGSGVFETFCSAFEFEDQFVIDSVPHFKQLIKLADEYENMMLVMIDSSRARIYELNMAGIKYFYRTIEEVPGRHKAGGMSQTRFQRHIEEHHDWHLKDVAGRVEKHFDAYNLKNVVLAGPEDAVSRFSTFLPKRVNERIFAKVSIDVTAIENEAIDEVVRHLQRHERETESRGVGQAIAQASIGGRGSAGLAATLHAINFKDVQRLFLSMGFSEKGGRCANCGKLYHRAQQCSDCGVELEKVDLAEAMVNAVVEAGGDVDMVKRNRKLEEFEGVATITRSEKVPT